MKRGISTLRQHRLITKLAVVLMAVSWGMSWSSSACAQERVKSALETKSTVARQFALVDQYGQAITDKDFRGRFMLLYFGYTYCPDVCPLGLQSMSHAIEDLGPAGERVTPVFITVDPDRDTREVLKAYAAHVHPRLVALTGTHEQISTVAKAYGVRYFKLFMPPFQGDGESQAEDANEDDDNSRYLLNHSASTYLVGPDAQTLIIFPHGTPPREMAREIQRFLVDNS